MPCANTTVWRSGTVSQEVPLVPPTSTVVLAVPLGNAATRTPQSGPLYGRRKTGA
ncbi:hypothetical protein FB563_7037 [Streptomyces puniciscabiei]|uniref:Uncharacterized protein n=1 Tax=Streptomyces puniciscabiei TaxID=164348 RepID=A0A542TJ73_9ACTN|nr:hypothetical protein FB563_8041 [Streptomyces puniciscabiei]TQK86881.1 hypothetical protein FB563_7037 [Streptomyces puniciscabiei]